MSVTVTGFKEAADTFQRAAEAMGNDSRVAAFTDQACSHIVRRAQDIVGTASPYRETGMTRADLTAEIVRGARGEVAVEIGAPDRSIVLAHLEYGTSVTPAYPVMRPAYDGGWPSTRRDIVDGFRKLLSMLGGR